MANLEVNNKIVVIKSIIDEFYKRKDRAEEINTLLGAQRAKQMKNTERRTTDLDDS